MNFLHNMPATATATIYPSTFLEQDSTKNFAVKPATTPMAKIVGISQAGTRLTPGLQEVISGTSNPEPAALANEGVGIYTLGDVCLLTVGSAAVTAGALLKNDLNANGIPASNNEYFGARAWQAGQPGEKIQVEVIFGKV